MKKAQVFVVDGQLVQLPAEGVAIKVVLVGGTEMEFPFADIATIANFYLHEPREAPDITVNDRVPWEYYPSLAMAQHVDLQRWLKDPSKGIPSDWVNLV